jgi:pilus assembly protein CpaB
MEAQSGNKTEMAMTEIFVTTQAIDVSEEITAEKIRLEQWPADRIPEGSTNKLEDLEGKFAKQRFYAGEPVMPVKLMSEGNGNATAIPLGYSVVSMKAEADSSAATLVNPGDRVDVMAYFTKSELIPETTAKTVLRGIRVFAVDGKTDREVSSTETKPARNIQLLIHKDDAEAWTYATELGKPRLQLCNPGDYVNAKHHDGPNVAGQEFIAWMTEHQRARDARKQAPPPVLVSEVAPVTPREQGFKMLKMSGDKLIEYEWVPGQAVPRVVGESESPEPTSAPAESHSNNNGKQLVSDPNDYSYLNGSGSPFFEQPKNTTEFNKEVKPPSSSGPSKDE